MVSRKYSLQMNEAKKTTPEVYTISKRWVDMEKKTQVTESKRYNEKRIWELMQSYNVKSKLKKKNNNKNGAKRSTTMCQKRVGGNSPVPTQRYHLYPYRVTNNPHRHPHTGAIWDGYSDVRPLAGPQKIHLPAIRRRGTNNMTPKLGAGKGEQPHRCISRASRPMSRVATR